MKKILFISNGHGEDAIAATIIRDLPKDLSTTAMPLVGEGKAYDELGIEIIGPRKKMPSGGFIYHNSSNLINDLTSGLIGNTVKEIEILRGLKNKFDLVVAVGDIVVIIGAILTKTPFVFIGCAKSDYYDYSYTPWEKWLLKKKAKIVFPRDQLTTDHLKKYGIKAEYLGNPMMDGINITEDLAGIDPGSLVIGFLPGSREDAFVNIEDLVKVAEKIVELRPNDRQIDFVVALADGLDPIEAAKLIPQTLPIKIMQGKFGDILNRSEIIVGLSGTGNEQAVGMGKPLVCFPSGGIQHTLKYAKDKKQLLGDSISLVENNPSIIAQEVWAILKDPIRQEKMIKVGEERMGKRGSSKKIADYICQNLA